MTTTEVQEQIHALELELLEKKKELAALRKSLPERSVENYEFVRTTGEEVTLLELFGNKDELIVIHNMGKGCSYCTLWADGFNGVDHHLKQKAEFVVSSPDSPVVQEDFAASRKWQFPMVSVSESTFAEDMGFKKDGHYHPGVSTFRKDEKGQIYLHAQAPLGPGDDYCVTWHLFDLLPSGTDNVKVDNPLNSESQFQLTNNIAVGVNQYERAVSFYRDVIGMKLEDSYEDEAKLSMSGTNFYIEENDETNVFFEFGVKSFEETITLLRENDCVVTEEITEKSVMIKDPYGLRFHLFEIES
ncbi:DUF899 family protein [Pontibacillus sp. HMF3514]|uniref:DUF899 family protein n=1 Tax=Pontibacillus sp. HMF3514 TaxID=2692425 RepID=UPI00131FA36F|nr:DUF899 family protein [Pontibacillus sp. HMF3514]QHE52710.1 DUF899 domain-containing protein [Pontibacillus sp. HMF3514]